MLLPFGYGLEHAPELTVRLILVLQVAMVGVGIRLLAGTKNGPYLAGVAASLALAFNFTKIFVNGLESALEFLLLAAALNLAERQKHRGLAVLCGLLCLARLSALPAAAVLLVIVLRREGANVRQWGWALLQLFVPVAAYSLFLYSRTGHALPISGAIKYGHAPWFWNGAAVSAAIVTLVALILGVILRAEWQKRNWPVWLAPLAVWIGVQLSADVLIRAVVVPEIWYLVPHATLLLMGICELVERRRHWEKRIWLFGAGVALLTWTLRVRPETYSFYVEAKRAGEWLATNAAPDARAAGWDCGITAFYSRRTFANLDGLASSWNYKLRYRDQGRVREFLDLEDVRYVAQYAPSNMTPSNFRGVDLSDWEVVYEEPYVFRGTFLWLEGASHNRYVILRRR